MKAVATLVLLVAFVAVGLVAYRRIQNHPTNEVDAAALSKKMRENPDEILPEKVVSSPKPPPPIDVEALIAADEAAARAAGKPQPSEPATRAPAAPAAPDPKEIARQARLQQQAAKLKEKLELATANFTVAEQEYNKAVAAVPVAQEAVNECARKQADLLKLQPRPGDFAERTYAAQKEYSEKAQALAGAKAARDKLAADLALARNLMEDLQNATQINPGGKSKTIYDAANLPPPPEKPKSRYIGKHGHHGHTMPQQ